MSLERIVRPAQTPNNSPAKRVIVRRASIPPTPVTLVWGVGGNVKQISGSWSESYSLYAKREPREFTGTGGV